MMRGTIYVTVVEGNEERHARMVRSFNVLDAVTFKHQARQENPGAQVDFGPIAPPWSKL